MFENMTLSKKITWGFGAVLVLLVIVGIVGLTSANSGSNSLKEYGRRGDNANLAGRIQANVIMCRLYVKDYVKTASDASVKSFNERADLLNELLEGAKRKNSAEVGTLKFVRSDGKVLTGGHAPGMTSRWEFVVEQFQVFETDPKAVSEVMDPHRPASKFLYMQAIAPEGFGQEAESEQEDQNQQQGEEEWEKKLGRNKGCFPFGWLFGI